MTQLQARLCSGRSLSLSKLQFPHLKDGKGSPHVLIFTSCDNGEAQNKNKCKRGLP